MKTNLCAKIGAAFLFGAVALGTMGCGDSSPQKENEFFTSGNREADQRADQRMVRNQQIKGESGAAAHTSEKPGQVAAKQTLYQRLGEQEGIKMIVEDFTARALADPRANWNRKGVKRGGFSVHRGQSVEWNENPQAIQTLKTHLVQFLDVATGGPSQYNGKEIKSAHQGMHITNEEFDAVIGDLKATLDKLKIGDKEQKELISIVESTRQEIVEVR
ncbi:MAG TPA: group 1 truncated hemoglobin [Humisphaera sp.]|jgi:hemoglobin|nr:group 1 truncated hemoglobin [Humisphaera sp.]